VSVARKGRDDDLLRVRSSVQKMARGMEMHRGSDIAEWLAFPGRVLGSWSTNRLVGLLTKAFSESNQVVACSLQLGDGERKDLMTSQKVR
jgi:hypothetical protein